MRGARRLFCDPPESTAAGSPAGSDAGSTEVADEEALLEAAIAASLLQQPEVAAAEQPQPQQLGMPQVEVLIEGIPPPTHP